MVDDPLFTLKQLADQLGLPESTVRYYRDAFLDHIPSVGSGRRRRYPAQAIAVLRTIARLYAAGRPRAEIVRQIEHAGGGPAVQEPAPREGPHNADDVSNLDLLAALLDGEREQRDALWQMAKEIVRLTEVLEGQDKVLTEIADRAGVVVSLPGAAPAARLAAPAPAAAAPAPSPSPAPPASAAPSAPEPPPPSAPPATAQPVAATAPASATVQSPERERSTAPLSAALFGESPPAPPPPPRPEPAPMPWLRPEPPITETAARPIHLPEPPAPRVTPSGGDDIERLRAELEAERELVERLRQSKLQLEHRVADAEATLEDRRTSKRTSVLQRLLRSDEQ